VRNSPGKICYFQGCGRSAINKEHIPPKAFFLPDRRVQLLTVPSCEEHNNSKSKDDLYVLAHVLLNVSPAERARDIFRMRVVPQLNHSNGAFRRLLTKDAVPLGGGAVAYMADIARLDCFFSSLACGIIFKIAGAPLPANYEIRHIYHNLGDAAANPEVAQVEDTIEKSYANVPNTVFSFGDAKTFSEDVYKVKVIGSPDFLTSVTLVHQFYGSFRVTSMLTRIFDGRGIGHLPQGANV